MKNLDNKNNIKSFDNENEYLIGFIFGYFLNIGSLIYYYSNSKISKSRKKGIVLGFKVMVIFILTIIIMILSANIFKYKIENSVYKRRLGPLILNSNNKYSFKYSKNEYKNLLLNQKKLKNQRRKYHKRNN